MRGGTAALAAGRVIYILSPPPQSSPLKGEEVLFGVSPLKGEEVLIGVSRLG